MLFRCSSTISRNASLARCANLFLASPLITLAHPSPLSTLLKHPAPNRRATHNPSRPPNPPNHKLGPHSLRNPPLRQFHQHRSQPLIPIPPQTHSVRRAHGRKRRQHYIRQSDERGRLRLAYERERRGEQADDEGQAEIQRGESGVACAEEEEGEGLEDLELLGFGVEGGFEGVGEGWGEED